MTKTVLKPSSFGTSWPASENDMLVSTAATAADDVEVPIERSSVLRPFAAAVSVIGTERMMSVGIAA